MESKEDSKKYFNSDVNKIDSKNYPDNTIDKQDLKNPFNSDTNRIDLENYNDNAINKQELEKYLNLKSHKFYNQLKSKEEIITELNYNFRTILSYGTANELIPNGQFIVKDIVTDKDTNSQNIILEQIDNPSINLILPRTIFSKFVEKAIKNSKDLNMPEGKIQHATNLLEEYAALAVFLDETLTNLQEVQVLPLEDNGIILLRDGKPETANYSICPVYTEPFQKHCMVRERIFEQNTGDNDKGKDKELEIPNGIFEPGPQGPKKPEILRDDKEEDEIEIEM